MVIRHIGDQIKNYLGAAVNLSCETQVSGNHARRSSRPRDYHSSFSPGNRKSLASTKMYGYPVYQELGQCSYSDASKLARE